MNYKELDCSKIYFTSDTHFGHKNIITYCDRPFNGVYDMNESMIENWNRVIPDDALTFHLGDFALTLNSKEMDSILHRLNGKIVLIHGNHEKCALKKAYIRNIFHDTFPIKEIVVMDDELSDGRQHVTLCHYPMIVWNHSHKGAWQLFGHVHGMLGNKGVIKHSPNQMDVGVDTNTFEPYSWQDIKNKITVQNLNKVKNG